MRPRNRSIAGRIQRVLTGLVCLAVSLAALLAFYVYRKMEEGMIDQLIQTESARLVSRLSLGSSGSWQGPFQRDMAPSMFAWAESPAHRAPSLPPELRRLDIGLHRLPREVSAWHVAVDQAMDGRLYVLYDTVVLEAQSRRFAGALVAIVLLCTLLAWFASAAVARRLVTPLNTLADRLVRWAPGAPIASAHANEADRLMEVFNRTQDQIDATIANQREFSANLHHEVRTPLTIIRSDAELLLRGNTTPEPAHRVRLQRIVRCIDEIGQSLESTYRLTHPTLPDARPVKLRDCVQDIIANLRMEAEAAGLVIVNAVDPAQAAKVNQHALMTVMRNIIRNALLHAAPATLHIESIRDGVRFTDTGPGIDAAELPHIFERYFSNRRADQRGHQQPSPSSGADLNQPGLGLAIAQRVCVTQSWQLTVTSPVQATSGTRFTLRLDP